MGPIPAKILSDSCVIKIPGEVDAWQSVTYKEVTVNRVHLQAENTVTKTKDNTEVTLTGTLFIDGRLSKPVLDYEELAQQSEEVGHPLRVICGNTEHSVVLVDAVPDDRGKLHHYELGLV